MANEYSNFKFDIVQKKNMKCFLLQKHQDMSLKTIKFELQMKLMEPT
jgi:hypothetical protein